MMFRFPASPFRPAIYLIIIAAFLLVAGCQQSNEIKVFTPVPTPTNMSTDILEPTPTERVRISSRWQESISVSPMLDVDFVSVSDEPASLQMPAFFKAIVVGRGIVNISVIAGQILADGSHQLVTNETINPAFNGSEPLGYWPDGIHEIAYVWATEGDYIAQGDNGAFVVPEDYTKNGDTKAVYGKYLPNNQDDSKSAYIIFDAVNGSFEAFVDEETGERFEASPGDSFQIANLIINDAGVIEEVSGLTLTIDDETELTYMRKPLTTGEYFLGIVVTGENRNSDFTSIELLVGNENLLPGSQAYLQPEFGFQFLYPNRWSIVESTKKGVQIEGDEATTLSVIVDPDLNARGPTAIRDSVLRKFGNVQILYEDSVQIGSQGGIRTIYGYQSPNGSHTGILINFVSNGSDYVVDLDGLTSNKDSLLEVVEGLVTNWIWREFSSHQAENKWISVDVDGQEIYVPAKFRYDEMANGWRRFSDVDENRFYAFRVIKDDGAKLKEEAAYWADVAQRNTRDYIMSNPYEVRFSGQQWLRFDFEYQNDELGTIWGAVMITRLGTDALVAWFESPDEDFSLFEEQQVTIGLAEILNQP